MSQNAIAPLNPATTSGSDLATKLVNNENSVLTQYSGATRPSYAQAGTLWLDTTTTNWLWKLYDGTNDITVAAFNATSHKHREGVAEATVASGATTDVLGSLSKFIAISGVATITSLGTEPNQIKFVRATGAFTLTHNATTLILPTGANIVATANDTFMVVSDASGNARVMAYQRASGQPLAAPVVSSFDAGTVMGFFQTAAPTGWTKDTINFNDYAIRIVTGAASSGGSLNFSTVMGYTATQTHVLTQGNLPAYDLSLASLTGSVSTSISNGGSVIRNPSTSNNTTQTGGGKRLDNWTTDTLSLNSGAVTFGGTLPLGGSGTGHSHNIDMRVRYVDMIRATKDA